MLLLAAVLSFQGKIRERYWIWKLRKCSPSDCEKICQEIVEQRIYSSIPVLFDKLKEEAKLEDSWGIGRLYRLKVNHGELGSGVSTIIDGFNDLLDEDFQWSIFYSSPDGPRIPRMGMYPVEDELNKTSEIFETMYSLFKEDPETLKSVVIPYLNDKSDLIRATAACLVFNDLEEIKKYVPNVTLGQIHFLSRL